MSWTTFSRTTTPWHPDNTYLHKLFCWPREEEASPSTTCSLVQQWHCCDEWGEPSSSCQWSEIGGRGLPHDHHSPQLSLHIHLHVYVCVFKRKAGYMKNAVASHASWARSWATESRAVSILTSVVILNTLCCQCTTYSGILDGIVACLSSRCCKEQCDRKIGYRHCVSAATPSFLRGCGNADSAIRGTNYRQGRQVGFWKILESCVFSTAKCSPQSPGAAKHALCSAIFNLHLTSFCHIQLWTKFQFFWFNANNTWYYTRQDLWTIHTLYIRHKHPCDW